MEAEQKELDPKEEELLMLCIKNNYAAMLVYKHSLRKAQKLRAKNESNKKEKTLEERAAQNDYLVLENLTNKENSVAEKYLKPKEIALQKSENALHSMKTHLSKTKKYSDNVIMTVQMRGDKAFFDKYNMIRKNAFENLKFGEKVHTCPECGTFHATADYRMASPKNGRTWECKICGYSF